MSFSVPSRRLLRGASALTAPPTTTTTSTTSSLLPALQSLTLTTPNTTPSSARTLHTTSSNQWFWNRNKDKTESTPLEQSLAGKKSSRTALVNSLTSRIEGPAIFEDEVKDASPGAAASADPTRPAGAFTRAGASLVREHLARAVDPDPRSRVRWERKMVIRQIRQGTNPYSREPRDERIARTERRLQQKSALLMTSTKKLVHVARQLAGKTVADALVQMRFSKKKIAKEVLYQLEEARDRAIAERGMGLGSVAANRKEGGGDSSKPNEVIKIQDKDGKWIKIDDPTRMYVAEAWVDRGPIRDKRISYRARGRMNLLRSPTASIGLVIKEEKTRIREAAERQAKKARQGPWVHLPDRPVSAQRQWYSW